MSWLVAETVDQVGLAVLALGLLGHGDVAAERQRRYLVDGLAAAQAQERRSEAERENLDAHPEQPGEREVTRFMYGDENAQADDGQQDGEHGGAV